MRIDRYNAAGMTSGLASSSTTPADGRVKITRTSANNEDFQESDAVLRCTTTFASPHPQVKHLVQVIKSVKEAATMAEYSLYWSNCWTFARTIFTGMAKHNWLSTPAFTCQRQDGLQVVCTLQELDTYLIAIMILGGI